MLFSARVVENRAVGPASFVLHLQDCDALAGSRPGQFVMLRGAWGRDPLLPRAFSILRTADGGRAEILVKAIGRGTRLLAELKAGERVSVLGPLGREFPAPEAGRSDLLVAGGVGLAPLLWHAEAARAAGLSCELFYGARSSGELVLLDEIERSGARLHLATEDGSRGIHGRVTAALEARLREGALGPRPHVLTCGPNAMMRAVVEIVRAHALPCFVSVEGEMACGIGACLGCAIPLTDGTKPFGYACVDGPVFDAARIVLP
ncbi:MAG TPA: dihydroorotate dehydrogenase electron transfer subunit [Polyangia bacterium]|nr:dihydroorotate dehydrogenase electron transfer subunit [Polyangia bacterium]